MVGRLVSKFLPQIALERKLALTLIKLLNAGVYINKSSEREAPGDVGLYDGE